MGTGQLASPWLKNRGSIEAVGLQLHCLVGHESPWLKNRGSIETGLADALGPVLSRLHG